ncbi:hypothetical protein FRB94_011150 [Tulasnella sp. JGI-2019a]|nr:hypothetical protein FRB94_011150 [Tulasnella sp. JGI-2019a]KAG9004528.1 hypothetical protein FRB93_010305 [Tulasnella sp. JGI-2019a]
MSTTAAQGISDTLYAKRTRELIKLITQLRGLGAQADVDLPRIAVIGNQSAGKSSLVEAISGITVPRSSGTCTRCPMECRLTQASPGEDWKCQVSLRYEFSDETGKRRSEVQEKLFGPLVTDPSLLEDVLRRAQLAILNPSVDQNKFVNFELSLLDGKNPPLNSSKQLQFSKNVVCLDLSGPDVTDLSFIDLPGIISNVAPGEDRGNIELVRNLVTEHIQGNCLILLTLTMRDDLENQSAAFLAKQVDPKGRRTIGVLTKPDTLQPGEESIWLSILEGHRHPLHHGYYMTKQPATRELLEKLSWEAAREREKEYFESTTIWAKSTATNRLGTASLTTNLSRLLSGLIDQTLPKLRFDASRSRESTRQLLTKLPPAISENPSAELLRMITAFSGEFRNYTTGVSDYASLIQQCKPAYEGFRDAVRATAPDFRPYTVKERKKYQLTVRFKDPEDDDTNSDESEGEGEDDDDDDDDDDNDDDSDSDSDGKSGKGKKKVEPMYVDEVKKYIHNSLTRELPFNVPFSAKEGLIRQSMKEWEEHAMDCFNIVRERVAEQLDTLVEKHFGRFARTSLLDTVFSIVQRLIEKRQEETVSRIKWLIRLEHRPYTQNHHYLTSYRDKYLSKYRGERRKKNKAHEAQNQPQPAQLASPVASNRAPTPDMFGGLDPYNMQSPPTIASPLQGRNGPYPTRGVPSRSNSSPLPPRLQMPQQPPPQPQPQPMMQQPQQQQQAQPNIENLLSQLSAAGYPVSSQGDLERLFASDPYEEVLVVMAEVRAYWQVSFKRIIDILPLVIDEDFLFGLAQEAMDILMEGLGMAGTDNGARAAEFLAEDPEIVAERDQLASKLSRVEDVYQRLSTFKS